MLTPQEGAELREKADAIGNSVAAGESAMQISDTIEKFKSAVFTLTESESSPIHDAPVEEAPAVSESQIQ